MRGVRLAAAGATLVALLLLAACGTGSVARSAPPRPRPGASRPARLVWRVGESFTGAVTFDEEDQGAVDDQLRFTAHERFRVVRLTAATASIRVAVKSWHWQRNTSELLTTSLPPPFTFTVGRGAEIVSGLDWPLPSDLPLPGLDVFAAPLAPGTGWSRTDGDGAGLSYQVRTGSPPDATALDWSVVRPRFTLSGEPITVTGHAEATVSSRYQRRGAVLTLRSTREQATFERTTRSAAGATQETGAIVETTRFSPAT